MADGQIQYDEQRRPYLVHGGRRVYVSPSAMGTGGPPPDETGIFRSRPQWNQKTGKYETPIDWGNIANIGVASLLTAGAANAFLPAAAATPGFGTTGIGGGTGMAAPAASAAAAGGGTTVATTGAGAASRGFWGKLGGWLTGRGGEQVVNTAGQLIGNRMQANASDRASDAQAKYLNDALEFEKGVYEDDKRFFAPWAAMGDGATVRLSSALNAPRAPVTADSLMASGRVGAPPRAVQPAPGKQPVPVMGSPRISDLAPTSSTMPVREGGGQLVRVQAPDGEIRELPEDQANAFIQRGAKRVA